jgi:predicted  nucleic acid-binding Zn-ribbon protein
MTLGPMTCISCGATFQRVRVPYTTCPDCRLAALRPRTAEPEVRQWPRLVGGPEREGWVKRLVATAMLNAISEADLDNYDRARDERHEAELERREG